MPERREPRRHLADAADPVEALLLQELREARMPGIEEVGEHVHVALLVHGGDLDAVDQRQARGVRRGAASRETGNRVVIRDGDGGQPRGVRAGDERAGRQLSVRRGRVKMEVDHADGWGRAFRLAGLPRPRRCRSTSARYSRISSSR
jgi:hypothetical protein